MPNTQALNADGSAEGQTADPVTPTSAEGTNPGAGATAQTTGQTEKMLPQSEVDAIAARTREEATARMLKKFGVTDEDALAARLAAADEAETAKLGEVGKLTKQLEKANDTIAELQATILDFDKVAVLAALGLDPGLKGRLRGETRDELEADAKALAEVVKPTPAASIGAPTAPATGNTGKSLEQQLEEAQAAGNWDLALTLKSQIASQVRTS